MTKRTNLKKTLLQLHLIGANFSRIFQKQRDFLDLHAYFRRLYDPDRQTVNTEIKNDRSELE